MQVLVRDNNVDQALRALKKKMQREGIFREMKMRGHYEKPSEKRAREKAEAVRRARKLARKRAQREGLLPTTPRPAAGAGGPVQAVRRADAAHISSFSGDTTIKVGRCESPPPFVLSLRSAGRGAGLEPASSPASGKNAMNAAIGDRLSRSGGCAAVAALLAGLAACRLPDRPDRRNHHHRCRAGIRAEHLVADRCHPAQPAAIRKPTMCAARPMAAAASTARRCRISTRRSSCSPNFYQAYANRALIHRFLGDQAGRARRLQPRRSRSTPTMTPPISAAATSTARPGRTSDAFNDFQKAIQLDTTDPRAYHNRGLIYQSQGQHAFAIEDFSTAISLSPDSAGTLQRPRPVLSGDERRGQRLRRLQHRDQARRQDRRKLGQPGADL